MRSLLCLALSGLLLVPIPAQTTLNDLSFKNYGDRTQAGSAPNAPSSLAATAISSSQIDLSWTDNSSNESGFQVERSSMSGSGFSLIATTAANATSYSSTSLASGTTYYYRVRAVNGAGSSAYSNQANATTTGGGSAPAAPSSLTATGTDYHTVTLNWTDNASNESGFQIDRSPDGSTWTQVAAAIVNRTSFIYSADIVGGTTYYWRIRAYNSAGTSSYSNTANLTTAATPTLAEGTVPGMWSWHEVDFLAPQSNGSAVTAFADHSSQAHDATFSGSPSPIYQTSRLNYKPTIKTIQGEGSFTIPFPATSEWTVYVIVRSTYSPINSLFALDATKGIVSYLGQTIGLRYDTNAGAFHSFNTGRPIDARHYRLLRISRSSSGNLTFKMDGESNDTFAEPSGSSYTTLRFTGSAEIAAALVYNQTHNSTQENTVTEYLRAKYRLYQYEVSPSLLNEVNEITHIAIPNAAAPAAGYGVVLLNHGYTEDPATFFNDSDYTVLIQSLTEAGYIVAATFTGNSWGAPVGIDRNVELYQYLTGNFSVDVTRIGVFGRSMGGIAAQQLTGGMQSGGVGVPVTGFYGSAPVCSLADQFTDLGVHFTSAKIAFGVSPSVTVGDATYNSVIAPYDPYLLSTSNFTGDYLRWMASASDVIVRKDHNTDKMQAKVALVAAEATINTVTGLHGDPVQFTYTAWQDVMYFYFRSLRK